jgi:hypothetical protein
VILAFDFKAGRHVGGQHAKRLLRRADVDRLPVAVEHQNYRFVQDIGHKNIQVFVLC